MPLLSDICVHPRLSAARSQRRLTAQLGVIQAQPPFPTSHSHHLSAMAFVPQEEEEFEIMMTPMIDCVFLLLVYFLVATSFYKIEKDITITLPTASESSAAKSQDKEVVVNVRKNGVMVVRQRVVELTDLEKMLADAKKQSSRPTVIIRGDSDALHLDVVKVMNTCLKSGITNVSVATFKPQESGGQK